MKFLAIAFATLMLVLTASAQDTLELNADYMYTHLSSQGVSHNVNTGWDFNANIPLFSSKNLGALVDFSGAYADADLDNVHLFTYGGGLQYTFRQSSAFQPFVNTTVGVSSYHTNDWSVNKVYISPGGGVDVHVTGGFWVRGAVDYFHTGIPYDRGVGVNGVRVLGGLTYRF